MHWHKLGEVVNMSAPYIIISSWLSSRQKLSNLVEIWQSYAENNFDCFLRHGVFTYKTRSAKSDKILTHSVCSGHCSSQAHREGGKGQSFSRAPPSLKNIKYTKMCHFRKQNSKNFLPIWALRECFPWTPLQLSTSLAAAWSARRK